MAGEPSLFLVYKDFTTAERISDSWHATQALADAAATDGGVGFTAHQGALKVPENWVTGWIYNPTDDKWRELGFNDLDEVEQLKATAQTMMDVFQNALVFISVHRSVWPRRERNECPRGNLLDVGQRRPDCPWNPNGGAARKVHGGSRKLAGRREWRCWGVRGRDGVTALRFRPRTGVGFTPEMDPYTRVGVGSAGSTFGAATNVANAPSARS